MYSTLQARLEQKLDKLMTEVRAGMPQGSVISVDTVNSLPMDKRELWRELRRKLEAIEISAIVLTEKKRFIVGWFKKAIEIGALEEIFVVPEEDDDSDQPLDVNTPPSVMRITPETPPNSNCTPLRSSSEGLLRVIREHNKMLYHPSVARLRPMILPKPYPAASRYKRISAFQHQYSR
ncbi:hypothetical protein BDD12DRAFT_809948 [Trichophaea hybrida]|nr:hypothetical protein BDD12DRAFT_809948 [Trichophaea hybrida]